MNDITNVTERQGRQNPTMIDVNTKLELTRQAPEFADLMTMFNVNMPGVVESLYFTWFDKLTYPAVGINNLRFFQTPIGGNNGAKTIADTNMQAAGQFSAPKQFLATTIMLDFQPAAPIARIHEAVPADLEDYLNDVQAVLNSGVVKLTVGDKPQNVDYPIGRFPPSWKIAVDAALSDTTSAAAAQVSGISYGQSDGERYIITPMNIPWGQNFDIQIDWPTAVTLPSGDDGEIIAYLGGYQYRAVQ